MGSSWTGVATGLQADTPYLVGQAQPEGWDFLLPTKVTCSLRWPFEPQDLSPPTVFLSPLLCQGLNLFHTHPTRKHVGSLALGTVNLTHSLNENQLPQS